MQQLKYGTNIQHKSASMNIDLHNATDCKADPPLLKAKVSWLGKDYIKTSTLAVDKHTSKDKPNCSNHSILQGSGGDWEGAATGGGAGACLFMRRGERAFTTILILGLNSASYCTHRAATAANCRNKLNLNLSLWNLLVQKSSLPNDTLFTRVIQTFATPFGG